ncbi:MAG: NAD(P)-dependent oxidoreductase [Ignavibacteriales bacterium]|nr:NAD(P)-dependent oxidoreductase [Ignavibacteriales bacterium]
MKQKIGFIGLGLMGFAMARRLQQTGYPLVVYNRTAKKARELVKAGASLEKSPAGVAEHADLVFSAVSTSDVLREVALGEKGILSGLREDAIHVDCSTVSPALTSELARKYSESRRWFLHCPVLGSVPQASEGSLLMLAGGDPRALERATELLKVLGNKVWKFDRVDQASHAKLLCNSFIAGMIVTLAQAIAFAGRVGVSPETILEIIGNSTLNAPTYQTKGRSIIGRNFTPRFYTEHMLKDINLIVDSARRAGSSVPGIQVAQQLFSQAVRLGYGKEDYSSIIKVLELQNPL